MMNSQTAIQRSLKQRFPAFGNKQQLIDYFVSFDFPIKQKRMVKWWEEVIQFLMEQRQKVYITYDQIIKDIRFYNLEPVPVKAIINHLAQKDILTAENEMETKLINETKKNSNKSWFNSILTYMSNKQQKVAIFTYNGKQKIFSKKLKELKKQQIKKHLHLIFEEHLKCMDQFKLIKLLESRVSLDTVSVQELIKQLAIQGTIKTSNYNLKSIVLFSVNPNDLNNKEWNELEKMKHQLKIQIQKFQTILSQEEEKKIKLNAKAREQAINGNSTSAKASLREILESDKKFNTIFTHKNVLKDILTKLEYNEMNKSTISILEQAQTIYHQTMIGSNRLDEVLQKNMEIEQIHKETNQKIQALAEKDENQEQVENMMKQLQRQVGLQKRPEKKKVIVQGVGTPMDIQGQEKQYHFN